MQNSLHIYNTKNIRSSDVYNCGVVEGGIFVAEEVAEGIADEVGISDCQVGGMM